MLGPKATPRSKAEIYDAAFWPLALARELDDAILALYRQRFPGDRTANDLTCWDAFEADHPTLFGGMYIFWVQKP